jgi:hypothetical protein
MAGRGCAITGAVVLPYVPRLAVDLRAILPADLRRACVSCNGYGTDTERPSRSFR